MSIRKDYTVDVLRLLDNLKGLVEKPKSFLGITFGFDRDEIAIQIDKIRASMPRELKDAVSLTREGERVIEEAKEEAAMLLDQAMREAERAVTEAKIEAERLIETAHLQQESMVAESEVLKLARAQSDEIRSAAEHESREMRRGAERYAYSVLGQIETVAGRVLAAAEKGRTELEPMTDNRVAVVTEPRDKARV